MVDWKRLPKVDAHIHLLPEDVINANIGLDDPFIKHGSVYRYLDIMKEYNIESAYIMPFNDPFMLSMDFNVGSVHRNLLEIVNTAPAQLKCFADVDIRNSIDETLREFEHIFTSKHFIGIKLHPTNTGYPIDGDYYDQIFRYAIEKDLLIEIHSYPRENLQNDVCSPTRIRKVRNRYPNLQMSIAHLGGFQYEYLYGLNIYVNISSILPALVNRIGITESNELLRKFGIDRLIFATDYPDSRTLHPNAIYDTYFDILNQMDFTLEEAENICKYNALNMIDKL